MRRTPWIEPGRFSTYSHRVRGLGIIAPLLCSTTLALSQQLPQKSAGPQTDSAAELFVTPPLVLEAKDLPPDAALPTPDEAAVARAKKERDSARSRADRWARLQRAGVLSKVEAERASKTASQANLRYLRLHVAFLRAQLSDLKERKADPALIETAEASLLTAETLAAEAEAGYRKLETALAETNVARRRALARAGIGSKSQLRQAESELARVRATSP